MNRRSIHDQARGNLRASFLYGFFLVVLLAAVSACIVGYEAPDYWYFGAAGGAALGLLMAVIARYAGSAIVLSMSGAREASAIEDRVLDNVAEEMAIAAGIPKPRVMIIDDSAPNAFATGPDPKHATVVFTTGIIEKLDRDELQGIFRVSYDLLAEAGKDARWETYDHDEHGFIYVRRNDRGEYRPDPVQIKAVGDSNAFFDRYLKVG